MNYYFTNFTNTALAHTGDTAQSGAHGMFTEAGMMGGFGWLGISIGWFFMVLFWALVVLGVIALFKYIAENGKENERRIRKIYACAECGYEFEEKELAMKCQKWCAKHNSCNLDIIKHGKPPQHI